MEKVIEKEKKGDEMHKKNNKKRQSVVKMSYKIAEIHNDYVYNR